MYPKIKIEAERYDEKRSRYKCNIFVDGKKRYYDLPKTIYELLKKFELSDNSDNESAPKLPGLRDDIKTVCDFIDDECYSISVVEAWERIEGHLSTIVQ